uniref:hypothetical protein n=1 Tax=Nitrospira cf. moscoviensis SBR1015 TaxID=96242 RepID=UPI00117C88BE|nr:hypothetical protein [Nitrospira cf. moscoviensis SBR1015]
MLLSIGIVEAVTVKDQESTEVSVRVEPYWPGTMLVEPHEYGYREYGYHGYGYHGYGYHG